MRLKELTDKNHPEYWKARWINKLNPTDPPWHTPASQMTTPDQETQEGIARFQKAMSIVQPHCKEIIAVYKKAGKFLYRGVKGQGMDIFVAGIRPDRKSGYLNSTIHKLETYAIKKLGGEANRSNSIFCSGSLNVASGWGDNAYAIFPKDGWVCTYFQKQGNVEYMYDKLNYMNIDPFNDKDEEIISEISKTYKRSGITFNKKELPIYLQKKRDLEVLISGHSYIGIEWNKYSYLLGLWLEGKPLNTKPRSIKDVKK